MHQPPRHIAVLASLLSLLLLVPASALACTIPIRRIGPIELEQGELKRPVYRVVERSAWGVDASWISTTPRLSQFVILQNGRVVHGATYKRQQALSIDAPGPVDGGWLYFNDSDPMTPTCALTGQAEWQLPKIRVRQMATKVRVAATTQRTVGDRTGCILGPDQGVRPCPNLARNIIKLAAPLGERELTFERF